MISKAPDGHDDDDNVRNVQITLRINRKYLHLGSWKSGSLENHVNWETAHNDDDDDYNDADLDDTVQ